MILLINDVTNTVLPVESNNLAVGLAVVLLGAGLVSFFQNAKKKTKLFYSINILSWLLISSGISCIFFAVFKADAQGTVLNFKIGGVLAGCMLIWMYGIQQTNKANNVDKLESTIVQLNKDLETSRLSTKPEIKPQPLNETKTYSWKIKSAKNKQLSIITGNIINIKNIDVWVNSENTNMQMARFYDKSISGTIRFMGAKKDAVTGFVEDDVIANELAKLLGENMFVQAGKVVVTNSGELKKTHSVKKIFHVAAVQGELAAGYRPINNLGGCISACLTKADELTKENISTILFPIIGAGTATGNVTEIAKTLIEAAGSYLTNHNDTNLGNVYFLAYTDFDYQLVKNVLENNENFEAIN